MKEVGSVECLLFLSIVGSSSNTKNLQQVSDKVQNQDPFGEKARKEESSHIRR